MRCLIFAVVALVAGAVLGGLAYQSLSERSAYPRAVMVLLQSNAAGLRRAADESQCDAATLMPMLVRLHAVGGEIEDAFLAADADEPEFRKFSASFRDVLRGQLDDPPADCDALAATRSAIGDACKACHQVYRG